MKRYYLYKNNSKPIEKTVNSVRDYAGRYDMQETDNPEEADLVISLGGDGTFLDAAKLAMGKPIFGINKGTLGFLTDVEEDHILAALTDYSCNNYSIKSRMMLDYYGKYVANTEEAKAGFANKALNDIVISKRNSSLVDVDVIVDDVFICNYRGDGVIAATPTGSTGYCLSCGGPFVDPSAEMIIITPISPHSLCNRSICLSANSKVELRLNGARGDDGANISVDGSNGFIPIGETITIRKASVSTNMVVFDENSFLEKIKRKMG